jgi:uncharacterized protein YjiS (DUF1127 family)
MSHTEPAPDAGRSPPTLPTLIRIAGLIRRGWQAYWDRRARRATVLLLRTLDRRTLSDIGIAPSEIESVVYGCGEDRRRRYDTSWPDRTT